MSDLVWIAFYRGSWAASLLYALVCLTGFARTPRCCTGVITSRLHKVTSHSCPIVRANACFPVVLTVTFTTCTPYAFVFVLFSWSEKLPLVSFSGATLYKASELIQADVAEDTRFICRVYWPSRITQSIFLKTKSRQWSFLLFSWLSTMQQPD